MPQRRMIEELSWNDFSQLPLEERAPYFLQSSGRPYHCVIAQQFDRESLDNLCDLATRIRRIAKSKVGMDFLSSLMRNKRAMLYFTQPSTRTFLSFFSACQILGFSPAEVRDPSISSEMKGETKEDTIRTFSSFFDLIIMRTPQQGFAEQMAWMLSRTERPVPIVNAGSGKDQHPTQALLDIYTLTRSFEKRGGIDGKTVLFCGDLARGRTVRSLSGLLMNFRNVKQIFAAPDCLQIGQDILDRLKAAGVEFEVTNDFKGRIKDADAIYMTRLQDEWDAKPGESKAGYAPEDYFFTGDDLRVLSPKGIIMHPLPRRKEISVDCDDDPRAVYWRQERNGMWIRAALIATIFCRDQEITQYYMLNNR
ncbi:MAG: aspartate carbamoyltransferase [Lentisphaeria bacterium]|nr:aspartate carbamoyltransferase [Lentisphaeria bacterium]